MTQKSKNEPGFIRLIRLREVQQKTGLSRSGIYERIQNGGFPKQVRLDDGKGSGRAVAFVEAEIDQWVADCIQSRDKLQGA